jgi:hypothetical protein
MPKKPSKSMKDAAERIAQPPRSSVLGKPATPSGYRAPQDDRPKGATPRKPQPMTPLEAKRAAKQEDKRRMREEAIKADPLRHITPIVIDMKHRIWTA